MDARRQQAEIAKVLYRSVLLALQREGEKWDEPVARRARVLAHRLFIDIFDGDIMPVKYKRDLYDKVMENLAKTERGEYPREELRRQARLISDIIAHHVVDSVVTAGAPEGWVKQWVSQQDDRVRTTHREANGEVVPTSEKFTVGGAQMEGPGDLTAPVDEIAGCRCFLLFGPDRESLTAATLSAGGSEMDDEMPEVNELLDVYEEVPWYGVLAPEGVSTGDRRKFDGDSLTWRETPLPLRWQKYDDEGHRGSVVVGNIGAIKRKQGQMRSTGVFSLSSEANEVIGLVAEEALRGVSVDLDDAEIEFRNRETGELIPEAFDSIEEALAAAKEQETVVVKGRICSGAMCSIPAFAEAFIALGHPPEGWMDDEEDGEDETEAMAASVYAIDEKPWSDYPESAYDVQQWHRACLVHLHSGTAEAKADCKLPIRTPSGALSRAGVHAAASRVDQTDAPDSQIKAAKRALVRAYGQLGEDPPESLTATVDMVHEFNEVDLGEYFYVTNTPLTPNAHFYVTDTGLIDGSGLIYNPNLTTTTSGTITFKDLAPGKTEDGPGWLTHPVDTDRLRDYWTRGAGAAKIGWGAPGDFNRCRAHLAKYIKPQYLSGYCANRHYDALGFWPGNHAKRGHSVEALAASTGLPIAPAFSLIASTDDSVRPPKAWFLDPGLPEVTAMTITNEGRIYGHMAEWGTCHTGFDECIEPPVSMTDYQFFHLGAVMTDEGEIPCGVLTVDTGHAAMNWNMRKALAHYDDTGTVVAHIRVGEDQHGIWFAGAIASYATEQQIDKLRAAKISGDWRGYRGNLELIAALGVNAPGYPIVRPALAASAGERTSLVAAGLISKDPAPTHEDVEVIVARALSEYREFDAIKTAIIKKRRTELASLGRKDT